MSSDARTQVARLLTLVPYLLARGEVRVAEAAEHFNISPRQLRKDLGVLFMVGLPGGMPDDLIDVDLEAFEDEGIIRLSNADYLARPVRFAPTEAVALTVALGALLETADDVAAEVVERTLDKLRAVAVAVGEDVPRMHVDAADLGSTPTEQRLRKAIRSQRQVRLTYHAASHDDVSVRVVDPRAIAHVNGLAYLDAYCHTAQDDRAFRLDRVLEAEVLESTVADPQALPKDLTREWFTDGDTTPVSLRLAPEASWLPEYVPVRTQSRLPGGGLEVELDAASHQWVLRLLGRLTPHVRVLAPASLAQEHRQRLTQALALYDAAVGPDAVD